MLFDCLNTSWNSFGNFEISNEKVEKQQKEEVISYKKTNLVIKATSY